MRLIMLIWVLEMMFILAETVKILFMVKKEMISFTEEIVLQAKVKMSCLEGPEMIGFLVGLIMILYQVVMVMM